VTPAVPNSTSPNGRTNTKPITFHFPKQVRDQLKILAVEQGKTMHQLGAEAMNDLFAKFGKPEIAPSLPDEK
jgi:antitoxin-like ribbon-helix-helix protein